MNSILRIGVAGAGVFGGYHASKIAAHPSASLVGIYDIDATRTATLAKQHGCKEFSDFDALLAEVDAVVIATPAISHFHLAKAALTAGVHTLVEKPIALDVDEADILLATARKRQLTLQVGHQERYVLNAIGLLGRDRVPLKIDCVRNAKASGRCEDVSVVLDLMVHDIDLVRALTGAQLENVTASGTAHEVEAEFSLSTGVLVTLKASRRASTPDRRMTIVFDDGIVEFDFNKRSIVNSTSADLRTSFNGSEIPLSYSDPLAFGTDAFIKAIADKTQPIVSGNDGRDALLWARQVESAASISVDHDQVSQQRQRA